MLKSQKIAYAIIAIDKAKAELKANKIELRGEPEPKRLNTLLKNIEAIEINITIYEQLIG